MGESSVRACNQLLSELCPVTARLLLGGESVQHEHNVAVTFVTCNSLIPVSVHIPARCPLSCLYFRAVQAKVNIAVWMRSNCERDG